MITSYEKVNTNFVVYLRSARVTLFVQASATGVRYR